MHNARRLAWHMLEEVESYTQREEDRRNEAHMRSLINPLQQKSERKFIKMYRLSKSAFIDLCDVLETHTDLKSTQRVSLREKVLSALLFFAKGGYQCTTGQASHFSQEAMSVYIDEVTEALLHPNIVQQYIHFPSTRNERDTIKQRFNELYGIPGVIGCIDGCHFKIFKPAQDVEHLFYCRKHYHSINAQIICDADSRILSVNPKYGGSTHDAFIWENSTVHTYMENLFRSNEQAWLLGDSAYPQRPWMMTPYSEVANSVQENYNSKHCKARVIIENTFGRLKNRWRCCIQHRALHYKPEKCAKIITACCVLHNIALQYNVPDPDEDDYIEDLFTRQETTSETSGNNLLLGRALRDRLAQRLAI